MKQKRLYAVRKFLKVGIYEKAYLENKKTSSVFWTNKCYSHHLDYMGK